MKKLWSILLTLTLAFSLLVPYVSAEKTQDDSETEVTDAKCGGTYGENLVWSYEDGTLTVGGWGNWGEITGTDAFDVFYDESIPWYGISEYVKSIVVMPCVTEIGSAAFATCRNAERVSIPATVYQICQDAFDGHQHMMKDVYFLGSEQNWNQIEMEKVGYLTGDTYEGLDQATIHYNTFLGVSRGHSYTIQRVNCEGKLTKDGVPVDAICFYDKVIVDMDSVPCARIVNDTIESAMDEHAAETQKFIDENPVSEGFAKTVENRSISIRDDLISIQQVENFSNGGRLHEWFHCMNFDSHTGEIVSLPKYLGLSDNETKELVYEVIRENCDATTVKYPETDPNDYNYFLDDDGRIHLAFGSYEVGIGMAQDFVLDYTPAPQMVEKEPEPVETDEDTVELSIHCYGTDLSYEWEYSDDDGSRWIPADCEEPVFAIKKEDVVEGRLYRCTVTNDSGSVASNPIEIPALNLDRTRSEVSPFTRVINEYWPYALIGVVALALLIIVMLLLRRRSITKSEPEKTKTISNLNDTVKTVARSGSKFCGSCGTPRKGDEAFCTNCGHPFRRS